MMANGDIQTGWLDIAGDSRCSRGGRGHANPVLKQREGWLWTGLAKWPESTTANSFQTSTWTTKAHHGRHVEGRKTGQPDYCCVAASEGNTTVESAVQPSLLFVIRQNGPDIGEWYVKERFIQCPAVSHPIHSLVTRLKTKSRTVVSRPGISCFGCSRATEASCTGVGTASPEGTSTIAVCTKVTRDVDRWPILR